MRPSHRFVEHTSEVELHLSAPTLSELIAEAGRALGELMQRQGRQALREEDREIELRSTDEAALLVDWLNELVYFAEAEKWIPRDCEVRAERDQPSGQGFVLRARVRGAAVEHAPSSVKAATHHGLFVKEIEGGLSANVILDV